MILNLFQQRYPTRIFAERKEEAKQNPAKEIFGGETKTEILQSVQNEPVKTIDLNVTISLLPARCLGK